MGVVFGEVCSRMNGKVVTATKIALAATLFLNASTMFYYCHSVGRVVSLLFLRTDQDITPFTLINFLLSSLLAMFFIQCAIWYTLLHAKT